jgi:hypothetical protein
MDCSTHRKEGKEEGDEEKCLFHADAFKVVHLELDPASKMNIALLRKHLQKSCFKNSICTL